MNSWLVDTNILLDVIGADAQFGQTSKAALARCAEAGTLVINPVIYAEAAVWISSKEELEACFPEHLFVREQIPWDAAFLAAQAFGKYRKAGGKKQRMLADFLIGGHAAVSGHTLLTRDRGYTHYFAVTIDTP